MQKQIRENLLSDTQKQIEEIKKKEKGISFSKLVLLNWVEMLSIFLIEVLVSPSKSYWLANSLVKGELAIGLPTWLRKAKKDEVFNLILSPEQWEDKELSDEVISRQKALVRRGSWYWWVSYCAEFEAISRSLKWKLVQFRINKVLKTVASPEVNDKIVYVPVSHLRHGILARIYGVPATGALAAAIISKNGKHHLLVDLDVAALSNSKELESTVRHELIHVEQLESGRLSVNSQSIRWTGWGGVVEMDAEETSKTMRPNQSHKEMASGEVLAKPWEAEAYALTTPVANWDKIFTEDAKEHLMANWHKFAIGKYAS